MKYRFNRTLIIDDSSTDRYILKRTLSAGSFSEEYMEASTGVEALDKLTLRNGSILPNLIFLDVNMPVLNGFEFLDALQKIHGQLNKQIPVIIMCSIRDDHDKARAATYENVIAYLIKPVLMEDLEKLFDGNHFSQTA